MKQSLIPIAVFVGIAVFVHLLYIGAILPQAEQSMQAALAQGQSVSRSVWVILKDTEQEVCFILMLFGAYLMGVSMYRLWSDDYLFDVDLLEQADSENHSLTEIMDDLDGLDHKIRTTPLVQTLIASLRRYLITSNVQNASDAVTTSVEALAVRIEAGNSMIRYLIWAIPSIGFIGTVRGIGVALAKADEALAGDIVGMTGSLGVAFNSTLIALFISIILMFLLHTLQKMQDDVLVKTQAYCEDVLLARISRTA
ncbi:MAG: MotA/TolQ/ExbB proton channel family protein [Pseudomonadota bacterium]